MTTQSTSANSLYHQNTNEMKLLAKLTTNNNKNNMNLNDQDDENDDYDENEYNNLNRQSGFVDEIIKEPNYKTLSDMLIAAGTRDTANVGINREKKTLKLRDLLIQQKSKKRGFQIQTYFDALVQKDGSILLIPKDVNKNHYFIG